MGYTQRPHTPALRSPLFKRASKWAKNSALFCPKLPFSCQEKVGSDLNELYVELMMEFLPAK